MARPFLTARWENLCLFTYAVPPERLQPRLPPGLELDLRGDQAFVSLVAFQFRNTCVLGVPWPGYRNFAELNLRYYVRHRGERGVVFVREFVPQRLVAWLARTIYNEPYQAAPLEAHVRDESGCVTAEYHLTCAGRTHTFAVTGRKPAQRFPEDSIEHFFKEHRWGFGVDRRGQLIRYEVVHPEWQAYPVLSHRLELDWGDVYGPEWKVMSSQEPCSVILAVGSAVAVYPNGKI